MSTTDLQNIDNLTQNDELILPDICGTIIHTKVFKDKNVDIELSKLSYEIGAIKWVKFNDALALIRPYHNERKKIIKELIQFLANNC